MPLECATLPVPLDHDQPQGRQVALALYRLPASAPSARLGSLVMNPGGPGVPTQDFLAAVSAGVPPSVAARYDLVTFDPRGVGRQRGAVLWWARAGGGGNRRSLQPTRWRSGGRWASSAWPRTPPSSTR